MAFDVLTPELINNTIFSGLLMASFLSNMQERRRTKQERERERMAKKDKKEKLKQESSLRIPGRKVAIVSTASIPWMTGTAVNPTLRAAYMAHCTNLQVTLVTPWLARCDQDLVFPNSLSFDTPAQQEEAIRAWVRQRSGHGPDFRIVFYAARYDKYLLGVFPVGDLTEVVAKAGCEVVILEEPEHLTWYHHGPRWTEAFPHVVGVIHTSYRELSRRNSGKIMEGISTVFNALLCAIHCHKVVKLSDTVQQFPRSITCCVHGAARSFIEAGARKADTSSGGGRRFSKGAYTLGKVVPGKGWEELLAMLDFHQRALQSTATQDSVAHPSIDAFGSGEAFETVKAKAEKLGVRINWMGRRDHLDPALQDYQVFINASTSDVVATTSMEALAMGKWLICAHHPCNTFVSQFRNCLIYHNPAEFSANLQRALLQEPPPLSPDELRELGWEAATERMLDAGTIRAGEWPGPFSTAQEAMLWSVYNSFIGIEPFRVAINGGSRTLHAPADITEYDPSRPRQETHWSWTGWLLSLRPRLFLSIAGGSLRLFIGQEFDPALC